MKNANEIKNLPHLMVKETGIDGGCGYIMDGKKIWASVIWSNGGGWDHVSVSPVNWKKIPTWDEMCMVKNMFFGPDETVVQYHPAKSCYVNVLPNCLHLWKPQHEKIPVPPESFV